MTTVSWLHPALEKRCSATAGCGIFAREDIRCGERLAVFGGRVMLIDDTYDLPDRLQKYSMQIEERFVLGPAGDVEEDTDFFNHSCDPNCGFEGQIFLVAMRDISAGEEAAFDYAMTVSESVGSGFVFEMACSCGSSMCRKVITEKDWMLPELQARYRGRFSTYIQAKIENRARNRFGGLAEDSALSPKDLGAGRATR